MFGLNFDLKGVLCKMYSHLSTDHQIRKVECENIKFSYCNKQQWIEKTNLIFLCLRICW